MKIGIMTFSGSNDNYGQLLQCWALQTILKNMSHDAFVIRFESHHAADWKRRINRLLLVYPIFLRAWGWIVKNVNRNKIMKLQEFNHSREFDHFRSMMLNTTPVVYKSLKELQANPPKADCYVAGSDSIWAQLLDNPNNRAWFLDFGNSSTKRISYAASFLMNVYPSKLKPQLRELLSRFESVSVRETGGGKICKDVGINAEVTCDPSLLLTRQDYIRHFDIKENPQNYIYLYTVNVKRKDEIFWDELKGYADDARCDIKITVGSGIYPGFEIYGEDCDYDYCPIEKWLFHISNAKGVVATSFHGVVFSILMETPFVYVPFKKERERLNYRIFELLASLGLSDRIYKEGNSYKDILRKPIDWNNVRQRLKEIRNHSMSYLEKALVT